MKTGATCLVLLLSINFSLPLSAEDSLTLLSSAFQAHCVKCHGKGNQIEGEINLLIDRQIPYDVQHKACQAQ